MNFDVPQFIDVEDKIAFQLTAKQLGWFGLGGLFLFLAWNFASQGAFLVIAAAVFILTLIMAFLRPHGTSMAAFISRGFMFLLKPKTIIWKRDVQVSQSDFEEIVVKKEKPRPKKSIKNAEEFADILDHEIDR